jgi:hypothetical protein
MDLPQPNQVMTIPQVQDTIRNHLYYFATKHPGQYVVIILDGLNQALDTAGLFGHFPQK